MNIRYVILTEQPIKNYIGKYFPNY